MDNKERSKAMSKITNGHYYNVIKYKTLQSYQKALRYYEAKCPHLIVDCSSNQLLIAIMK